MDASPVEIRRALTGAEYPASAEELIAVADENGADEEVREALESLDRDSEFDASHDVTRALGEGEEELEADFEEE